MRYSHFLFNYLGLTQTGPTNQNAKGREMSEALCPLWVTSNSAGIWRYKRYFLEKINVRNIRIKSNFQIVIKYGLSRSTRRTNVFKGDTSYLKTRKIYPEHHAQLLLQRTYLNYIPPKAFSVHPNIRFH
jgi:hypothetical protein